MIDQRLSFGNNKKNKTFREYESFKKIINIINLILKFQKSMNYKHHL